MKNWKLIILVLIFATSAACTVDENSGLLIRGFLACGEEEYPKEGQDAKYQTGGVYDLLVAKYYIPYDGYLARIAVENTRMESLNEDSLAGEGNMIYLSHYEVKFEFPTDWEVDLNPSTPEMDDTIRISTQQGMAPEAQLLDTVYLIPESVRQVLEEYYINNAYKSVKEIALDRPDAARVACTADTAADICDGYPCIGGFCSNACTLVTGCADGFMCDLGAGDFGYCRRACEAGVNDCKQAGDLLDYECVKGMCVPSNTTVNPHLPEDIILKITAVAKDAADLTIRSNTVQYRLKVCRSCSLEFNACACFRTPIGDGSAQEEWTTYLSTLEYTEGVCGDTMVMQDRDIECAYLRDCYDWYCADIITDAAARLACGY